MRKALLATLLLCGLFGCRRPNQDPATPQSDAYCNAGTRVEAVNDNNVSEDVKNMIYGSWQNYHANAFGTRKVIFIPFQGATENQWNSGVTQTHIRTAFFGGGAVANRNVSQYLKINSYNQFDITEGEFAPLVTVPFDKMHYAGAHPDFGSDWTRNNQLANDILNNASIDWSSYDANGNHVIDAWEVQIVFLMAEPILTGACRPASLNVSSQSGNYLIHNGYVYITTKQSTDPMPSTDPLPPAPVIIHEMMHGLFNLPDRYESANASGSTGAYDVMSNAYYHVHMNMYDKIKLGWVRPKVLKLDGNSASACYEIAASATTSSALVVYKPSSPNEYWVIEYRSPVASLYDANIWEAGLAIWLVDAYETDEKKKVKLVNSQSPTTPPDSIRYTDLTRDALFRYTDAQAGNNKEYLLRSRYGTANILLRSVSRPLDGRMYFEL